MRIYKKYTSYFLGTIALDILHDCRECYISKGKMKDITDLMAYSFIKMNPISNKEYNYLQTWVFKEVCKHLFENVFTRNEMYKKDYIDFEHDVNDTDYWSVLFDEVELPIRSKCNEDKTKLETKVVDVMYNGQRISAVNKNWYKCIEFLKREKKYNRMDIFKSPHPDIHCPKEFSAYLQYFHSLIQSQHQNEYNITCMDQKGAAGLIRIITEPFGYQTTLPTLSDCGYNMIGMSGLRNNSIKNLQDFSYTVTIDTPIGELKLFDVKYKMNNNIPNIDINNMSYIKRLPSSKDLGKYLSNYLDYKYHGICKNVQVEELIHRLMNGVSKTIEESSFVTKDYSYLEEMTMVEWLLTLHFDVDHDEPKNIYTTYYEYLYLKQKGIEVDYELKKHKMGRKTLLRILKDSVKVMEKQYSLVYEEWVMFNSTKILYILETIGSTLLKHSSYSSFMSQWNHLLMNIFPDFLSIFTDDMFPYIDFSKIHRYSAWIKFIHVLQFTKKHFISSIYVQLDDYICTRNRHLRKNTFTFEFFEKAYYYIIGKFHGDFGQIMISANNELLYATEDTNTACMSLIIGNHTTSNWMTIYGKGDGSMVYVYSHTKNEL